MKYIPVNNSANPANGLPWPKKTLGSQYVQWLLRRIRLNSLSWLTDWRVRPEPPKVALYQSRPLILLSLLNHIIPFSVTILLLVLNLRVTFAGHMTPSTKNILQFAAKYFEILTQSSIATIVIDLFTPRLLHGKDVSIGSLLSIHQVRSISLLWSLDFWAAATSNAGRLWKRILFCLLILFSVLLANLVGPAGAIAMIPQSIDYPLQKELVLTPARRSDNTSVYSITPDEMVTSSRGWTL